VNDYLIYIVIYCFCGSVDPWKDSLPQAADDVFASGEVFGGEA